MILKGKLRSQLFTGAQSSYIEKEQTNNADNENK